MTATASESAAVPSAELLRQVRRLEIRARRLVAERLLGQYHSVFRGRGLEFSEVREYQPGDDVRTIDWNVTARMGAPYVKRFVEERELTVLLAVDVSASQEFGTARRKRELATEAASLIAFAATANNDRVGLLAFSDRIEKFVPPRKGSRHVLRLLRDLLSLRPASAGTDIGAAAGYLQRSLHRRAVIFLLSDFLDQEFEPALRSAARRHDLIGIVLSDPRERALPAVGMVEAEDSETGERFQLDTEDEAVRRSFAEEAAARQREGRRALSAAGVDAIEMTTDGPVVAPLVSYLAARARRR